MSVTSKGKKRQIYEKFKVQKLLIEYIRRWGMLTLKKNRGSSFILFHGIMGDDVYKILFFYLIIKLEVFFLMLLFK